VSASSTDIERIFSRGRDILTYRRNRLSAESVQALLCLGDWLRTGIVTIDDITGFLEAGDQGEDLDHSDIESTPDE